MLRNPPPTALETYKLAVTTSPKGVLRPVLKGILVQSVYASDVWLQVFEKITEPANNSVPIMASMFIQAQSRNNSIKLPCGGLPINSPGLLLVASSVNEKLTVDVLATLDITALIEEYDSFPIPIDATAAGDLTTGIDHLSVWNEAAAPKSLYGIKVKNNAAAVRYTVIYATDAPAATDKIIHWTKLAANESRFISFGAGGLSPIQKSEDGTVHQGCYVRHQATLTPAAAAQNDCNMLAYYR